MDTSPADAVAEYITARNVLVSGEVGILGEREAVDDLHRDVPGMTILVRFDGSNKGSFFERFKPRLTRYADLLAAEIGVVNFNPIDELDVRFALLHDVHELVLEQPGGVLLNAKAA